MSPPARSLFPRIRVDIEDAARVDGPIRLLVTASQLSDAQAVLVQEVLGQLPTLMAEVLADRNTQAQSLMVRTFTQPLNVVDHWRAEARKLAAWQQTVMAALPCLTLQAAAQRCVQTPWFPTEHLFWVAYRGRQCFPLCQFTAAGAPSPSWVALVEKASTVAHCYEWDLMAWLLTPTHFLPGSMTPLAAIAQDPKKVIQLAGLTLMECRS